MIEISWAGFWFVVAVIAALLFWLERLANNDNCAAFGVAYSELVEKCEAATGFELKYADVMAALKRSKMEHGLCEPVERNACTACAAQRKLDEHLANWKGARIVLAGVPS